MKTLDFVYDNLKEVLNDQTVVLAVSTGVDSMVLLDLVEKSTNAKIIVAHVNHHRRLESNDEQAFIEEYCLNHKIALEVLELNFENTQNFQNNARKERYIFFKEVVDKYQATYLLTAHHANDNLETIIMRLIKSSSLKGYAGIPKTQEFEGYTIYRPLINTPKDEIMSYAKENNIKYFDDISNDENDYLRNRIRHSIIPIMEQENPSLYNAVELFSYNLNEANDLLFQSINKFIKDEVLVQNNIIEFNITAFKKLSSYLKEQVLFELLKPHGLSRTQVLEIINQIEAKKNQIKSCIKDNYYFVKEYGKAKFGIISKTENVQLLIEQEGTCFLPNIGKITVDKNICYFETEKGKMCYNIYALPITIRNRLDGDRIFINNQLKNLSDYLTNNKVSHFERNNLLVMIDKDNRVINLIKRI